MAPTATGETAPSAESVAGEHGVQLRLLKAVEHAVREDQGADDVAALLDQLVEYTNVHFHSEELIMRLYAYPHYDAHRTEHAELMERALAMRDSLETQDQAGLIELAAELSEWLRRHMDGKDHGFETFLRRQAAEALRRTPRETGQ